MLRPCRHETPTTPSARSCAAHPPSMTRTSQCALCCCCACDKHWYDTLNLTCHWTTTPAAAGHPLPADTIPDVCCSKLSICLRAAGAAGVSGGLGTSLSSSLYHASYRHRHGSVTHGCTSHAFLYASSGGHSTADIQGPDSLAHCVVGRSCKVPKLPEEGDAVSAESAGSTLVCLH